MHIAHQVSEEALLGTMDADGELGVSTQTFSFFPTVRAQGKPGVFSSALLSDAYYYQESSLALG